MERKIRRMTRARSILTGLFDFLGGVDILFTGQSFA
jgi:hypothetical protein